MKTVHNKKYGLIWVSALSIFLFSSPGTAQEGNQDAAAAKSAEKSERECRTYRTRGSRMKRSYCLSKEEWAMFDAQEKELNTEQQREKDIFFRKSRQQSGFSTGDGLDNPSSP